MSVNYGTNFDISSDMNYRRQDVLQQTYDAVVVGSGATGGWAVWGVVT